MAIGPGKYDDLCTELREKSGSIGVAIIVWDGKKGPGFSVEGPVEFHIMLPGTLEFMAKTIRDDFKELKDHYVF